MKSIIHRLRQSLEYHWKYGREIGWWPTLLHAVCMRLATTVTIRLKTPHAKHPVVIRAGTSDIHVFRQIFCDREYSCFDDLTQVQTVIDCGANIGLSSIYFLSRFPECAVLAVEPDRTNFRQLEINLAPYAGRFDLRCATVWGKNVALQVSATPKWGRLVASWGVTVAETTESQKEDTQGLTVSDLIAATGESRLSLLKMDVEGAETQVFAEDCSGWLPQVDNMAIELHGLAAQANFSRAIKDEGFDVYQWGELAICRRRERQV
jgi:FkbM family methyltransferase